MTFSTDALSCFFERKSWQAFLAGNQQLADELKELSIAAHKGDLDDELDDAHEAAW